MFTVETQLDDWRAQPFGSADAKIRTAVGEGRDVFPVSMRRVTPCDGRWREASKRH